MDVSEFKGELSKVISVLKTDAVFSEGANERDFKRTGIGKEARKIIADKQYWNGYLDALNNIEEKTKKIR